MRRVLASAAAALLLAGCGGGDVGSQEPRAGARDADDRDRRQGRDLRRLRRRAREARSRGGSPATAAGALESTGSVENLMRLRDGKAQIALTLGDTALDAVEGREAFDRPVPLRALAQIYPSYVQLVIRADAPGSARSRTSRASASASARPTPAPQVVAERVLERRRHRPAHGVQRKQLGVAESAAGARGRRASTRSSGRAACRPSAVTELARAHARRARRPRRAGRAELRPRWGGVYEDAAIPAGTYPGSTRAVPTISIPNYIVVDETMNGALATT